MKQIKSIITLRRAVTGILMAAVIILLNACTKKIAFSTSSIVPAARGSVKIKKDNNHNYGIKIDLRNLAEIKRLEPVKQAYVVWMVSGEETKNLGKISSSSSMLSKNLKASFETVSSVKPSQIFITAEEDAASQFPGQQVLTTGRF